MSKLTKKQSLVLGIIEDGIRDLKKYNDLNDPNLLKKTADKVKENCVSNSKKLNIPYHLESRISFILCMTVELVKDIERLK